jgi:hypothetical protein
MTFFYDLNKKLDSIREKPETTHGQLNERDMSRAAKGYEKYGKQGMEALAKAGREGKALDPVRKKYNKYDEGVTGAAVGAGLGSLAAGPLGGAAGAALGHYAEKGMDTEKTAKESMGDMAKKVGGMAKKVGGAVLNKLGHGDDADMMRDLQRKMGVPQTGMKPGAEPNPKQVKEKMNPAKAKSFAALAEPKDKITFADKIAGAKKEVDERLGDVAAEAMKAALSPKQKKIDMNKNGKLDANDFAMLRKGGKQETAEDDDNPFTSWKKPRAEKPRVGSVERGHKHDIEHTATGRKVTRRVDDQGHSVGADDAADAQPAKRGRGRPAGTGSKMGAKGPSGRSKLMTKENDIDPGEDHGDLKAAMALLKKAGYKISKDNDKAVGEEKTTKRDNHAEKAGKKVTKDIEYDEKKKDGIHGKKRGAEDDKAEQAGKKVAKDIEYDEKKDKPKKVKEEGGTGTPTASSGFGFGKGIYDSLNRDLEAMIAESMSVNMSDSTEGGKSLTITATDEDALKLGMLLRNAGLGGGDDEGSYMGSKVSCPTCGSGDCGCGDIEKAIDENAPDWPTDEEGTEDAMMYSGGLNGPKSTGQTTVPVIASQENRQHTYEAELQRMRDIAGIKEAKKPDFLDVDKDGDKKEPFKKAVDDKKEKKVEESIFDLTNQWKAYKG